MFMKYIKKKLRKWKKIKFSKKIVMLCILFILLYTVVQTYLSYVLQIELSPTLTTCVYAFFGTELAATAILRVFDKDDIKNSSKKSTDADIDH